MGGDEKCEDSGNSRPEPLSFINLEAFQEGAFVFDNSEPGVRERLRDFLSQPYEEIERLWHEKRTAREQLIEHFIATGDSAAGRRAADAVAQRLNGNAYS